MDLINLFPFPEFGNKLPVGSRPKFNFLRTFDLGHVSTGLDSN